MQEPLPPASFDAANNHVTGISIQSGLETICTFNDVKDNPALSLVKTASPSTYSTVGQSISYSYLVTNTGNVSLAGPVTVTDDKATVTCPAVSTVGNLNGSLDPGESITCTASYSITQADLNSGSVTNVATAHAGGTNSNQDTETVTAVQTKTLSLVKSATPSTYSTVGQSISYSYLVTNTGNVRLAGPVTVADDKATVTCPAVSTVGNNDSFLDPGEAVTCTASYSITQADLNSGSVTNVAKASAAGVDSNEDTETVNAVQTKTLSLVKSATPSTYSTVGQSISYSYLVTNTGNVRLAGPVTVADDKATVTLPGREHGRQQRQLPRSGRGRHLHRLLLDHAGRPEQRLGHQRRQGKRGGHRLERGHRDRHRGAERCPLAGEDGVSVDLFDGWSVDLVQLSRHEHRQRVAGWSGHGDRRQGDRDLPGCEHGGQPERQSRSG